MLLLYYKCHQCGKSSKNDAEDHGCVFCGSEQVELLTLDPNPSIQTPAPGESSQGRDRKRPSTSNRNPSANQNAASSRGNSNTPRTRPPPSDGASQGVISGELPARPPPQERIFNRPQTRPPPEQGRNLPQTRPPPGSTSQAKQRKHGEVSASSLELRSPPTSLSAQMPRESETGETGRVESKAKRRKQQKEKSGSDDVNTAAAAESQGPAPEVIPAASKQTLTHHDWVWYITGHTS